MSACHTSAKPGLGSPLIPPDFEFGSPPAPRWHAVFTLPRHEKTVAKHFAARTIEYFLPLHETVHRWNRRRAAVQLPLFPGYIFVHIAWHAHLAVLTTPGVLRIVSFNGEPAVLPDEQVDALQRSLRARRAEPCEFLSRGQPVRIASGPLQGLEGVVVRRKNNWRVIVSVKFISRSIAVDLEATDLDYIGL